MQKKAKLPIVFLCASTLISFSNQLVAEEWSSIIKKNAYEIFVDIDSYNQENGWPFMTTKTVYKTPQLLNKKPSSSTYVTHVAQWQFNCKNPVYRKRFSTFLDQKERVIGQQTPIKHFQTIPVGSDIFAIGQLTCQVHQMVGGQ